MSSPRQCPWHHNARQYALIEYASLEQACPEGFYISLKPGSPLHWFGVFFVRKGPYAPAILRFHINFHSDFPYSAPVITFVTDIFHPLVTPLTTYTYTTGSLSSDTVSATDEERLPPGGFSLRHGFPHWFRRATAPTSSALALQSASLSRTRVLDVGKDSNDDPPYEHIGVLQTSTVTVPPTLPHTQQSQPPLKSDGHAHSTKMLDVLQYIKQSFDEEPFLDVLPLEAAGNPGAWKAWRAHRSSNYGGRDTVPSKADGVRGEEWDWNGVWEKRVCKGIDTSISDSVLYGGIAGGHEVIRFTVEDEETLREVRTKVFDSTLSG